jgi:hypothetical protein
VIAANNGLSRLGRIRIPAFLDADAGADAPDRQCGWALTRPMNIAI